MKVIIDTTVLSLLFNPNAKPPIDKTTKQPLEHFKERVNYLIQTLNKDKTQIIIPSPVLCEILVPVTVGQKETIDTLSRSPFKILGFDQRASIECSIMLRKYLSEAKNKKESKANFNKQKVKFDHQIFSIGLVEQVEAIYSDDGDIKLLGKLFNIPVIGSHELDISLSDKQMKMVFPIEPGDRK